MGTGNGKWEMKNRERKRETGNGEQKIENWERGTGNGEIRNGKGKMENGNFLYEIIFFGGNDRYPRFII